MLTFLVAILIERIQLGNIISLDNIMYFGLVKAKLDRFFSGGSQIFSREVLLRSNCIDETNLARLYFTI